MIFNKHRMIIYNMFIVCGEYFHESNNGDYQKNNKLIIK